MKRLDRLTLLYLGLAALWGVALVVLAATLSSSGGPDAIVTSSGHSIVESTASVTLVQENGPQVLIPVALPLLAVAVVGYALMRRRARGRFGPGPLAIVTTSLVGALCLVGTLTIGPFILPIGVLLLLACTRAPTRPSSTPIGSGLPAPPGSGP